MEFSCESLPGIAELSFYTLDEVSNWPEILTDTNSGQIVIAPEPVSVDAVIDPDSIDIDVNPKQNAEGDVFDVNISFRFITRSEALEQLMDQYKNKPGIVIAKLNNEFRKIYGSNEEPLFMNYKVEEGKKVDDNAGTVINIKGETTKRPLYYTT